MAHLTDKKKTHGKAEMHDGKAGTKSTRELRRFGITIGLALTVLGAIVWWRDGGATPYLFGAGGLCLILGMVYPAALRPLEFVWMKLALVLSYVMTRVLLTLAFFLAILPTGLLLRLLRKDLLSLELERGRESYWVAVEADGSRTRPDKPY